MEKELVQLFSKLASKYWRVTEEAIFVLFKFENNPATAGINKDGNIFVGTYVYHLIDFDLRTEVKAIRQRVLVEQKAWCLNSAIVGLTEHIHDLATTDAKEILFVDNTLKKASLLS